MGYVQTGLGDICGAINAVKLVLLFVVELITVSNSDCTKGLVVSVLIVGIL
jgi:hypothetical protein